MQSNISPASPADVEIAASDAAEKSEQNSAGRSVAKATLIIGIMHFLRFAIGVMTQPLIGHNLGLRWQADAYAVSTEIVRSLSLIWEKIVNPAFLPVFIRALKEDGEERAWRLASTATWITGITLLIATPLAWWAMPTIVDWYSQKSDAQQRLITVQTARTMLPALFFLGMASLTYTILNGYKRFAIAAFGDTLWKLGAFFAALIIVSFQVPPQYSLQVIAWGSVAGAFLKLAPQLIAIGPKWKMLKPKIDFKDPLTRTMLLLGIPLICGIVTSELRGVYLQRLADDPKIQVEAGRAAVKWSRIIGDSLIQMFPYALSIGIFPYLADMAREKDRQPLTDTLIGALRVCVFFFAPVTAILIAMRFPLLRAVWESGRLTQADTIAMSGPFVGFTVGLIGFACEMMLTQTFYAMTRAWTPTLIGIGISVFWLAFAHTGVNTFGWGLAAIALSESLSKSLKCIWMWLMLRPHLGDVKVRENLIFVLQVLVGSLLAALVASLLVSKLAPADDAGGFKTKMLLAVALSGTVGALSFFGFATLLKVREAQQFWAFGGKIKSRVSRRK